MRIATLRTRTSARFTFTVATMVLALPLAAQAQEALTVPLRVVLMDEQMRALPGASIEASFEQTVVVPRLFSSERRKSTVALACVTDGAGACLLKAPLSFGSGSHNWGTRALVGKLDSVAGRAGPLAFEQSLAGPLQPGQEIGLVAYLGTDGAARLGRFAQVGNVAAIAAGLDKNPGSTAENLILSSFGARGLWNPGPGIGSQHHGYLVSFTKRSTGEVSYELRADVTSGKSQDLLGGNKARRVAPAEARVGADTWVLPGVRLSQVPVSRSLRPLFGSPKDLDADEVVGVREVFAYPLTAAQVEAMMAGYVEGSDAAFTFSTGKDNGDHVVTIPLVEVRALLRRREALTRPGA